MSRFRIASFDALLSHVFTRAHNLCQLVLTSSLGTYLVPLRMLNGTNIVPFTVFKHARVLVYARCP